MRRMAHRIMWFGLLGVLFAAAPAMGDPEPGQLGFQPAASELMERMTGFHNYLLVFITIIAVFVMVLLLYAMVRFRKSANPTPRKFSHNTLVEVIWTGVPVLILIAIAIPSFRLLYYQDRLPEQYDLTVKVLGQQWKWSYEYPDDGIGQYDSNMLDQSQLPAVLTYEAQTGQGEGAELANLSGEERSSALARLVGQYSTQEARARVLDFYGHEPRHYRLAVDNPVVAPVNTNVRVQVTAFKVIHNWALGEFGIKTDAIPGRLNETWFNAKEPGTYYGQCSELCGINHAFMPIQLEIVPQDVFDEWVATASQFGGASAEARAVLNDYKGRGDTTGLLAVNAADSDVEG